VQLEVSLEDPKTAKVCAPDSFMWPTECNDYAPHVASFFEQDKMYEETEQPGLRNSKRKNSEICRSTNVKS
jgi:hypothetical protein